MRIRLSEANNQIDLEKKRIVISKRVLGVSPRIYLPVIGGGDTMRTIVIEAEFNSLATIESFTETMGADSEMQELFPKMAVVYDSVEIELYTPIP